MLLLNSDVLERKMPTTQTEDPWDALGPRRYPVLNGSSPVGLRTSRKCRYWAAALLTIEPQGQHLAAAAGRRQPLQ
jgi:hypothetical protein